MGAGLRAGAFWVVALGAGRAGCGWGALAKTGAPKGVGESSGAGWIVTRKIRTPSNATRATAVPMLAPAPISRIFEGSCLMGFDALRCNS